MNWRNVLQVTLRRSRCLLVGLAFGAGVLAQATDAQAFCRTTTCDRATTNCRLDDNGCVRDGVPLKWKTFPIRYRFHRAGSEKLDNDRVRVVVRKAFQAWSSVQCGSRGKTSVEFDEGSDVVPDKPLGQKEAREKFGIYFRDEDWPHNDTDESLALTNQVFGVRTGTIDYADIEINTANYKFALTDQDEGIDLQAVLTHEVGHYLGLAHTKKQGAIMVARYCEDQERCTKDSTDAARDLADDDRLGVCTIYPPLGAGGGLGDSADAAGCSAGAGATAPLAELGLAAGALTLGAALQRRRRARSAP